VAGLRESPRPALSDAIPSHAQLDDQCGVLSGMPTAVDTTVDLRERLSRDVDGGFEDLVVTYQRSVYTTALRISGRPADAADLAAETFLRAYAALRRYRPQRIRQLQVRPWLVTILLNLWRNQVRAATRAPVSTSLDTVGEPAATATVPPEMVIERRVDQDQLVACLVKLAESQRTAVVLRHVVGFSYAEIGVTLGCPEGTAKSHVARGLQRLRQLMITSTSTQPHDSQHDSQKEEQ
jgi:RNA polymerase sigma-70 factor (ECF subfamily)